MANFDFGNSVAKVKLPWRYTLCVEADKMRFGVPIGAWLRGPLRLVITDPLTESGHRVSLVGRADGALRDVMPCGVDMIEFRPASAFHAAVAALRAQSAGLAGVWPAWRLARRLSPTLRYLPALAGSSTGVLAPP